MKFDKNDVTEIFENAISWVVVFAMFIYGGSKAIQFGDASKIDKTISQMTGLELMWAFYGYSVSYAIILGFFEILGGILLLIPKTRLLGCLFLSTILINVIIQDIVFEIPIGALKAAIVYQILILIILWIHRIKLYNGIKSFFIIKPIAQTRLKFLSKLVIAFLLFVVFRILEFYITIKW